MQKKIITVLLLLFSFVITAQDSGITIEIHYPITASEEHYGELVGVLGAAFQFQISDDDILNYGLEYKFDTNQATIGRHNSTEVTKKMYLYNHINLFSKINLDRDARFKLYLDGGLSIFKYNGNHNYIGYNAGAGLAFDIMDGIYIFSNYNFVKANKKQSGLSYKPEETLGIIRFGIGFTI